MNTQILDTVEQPYLKERAKFGVGDTVDVHTIVREGEKQRVQIFKGLVIAIKGSGTRKTFTVRKISDGIGVEKIFPVYSPNIETIEIVRKGKVKQSKLYYMRDRTGKRAMKVTENKKVMEEKVAEEPKVEEVAEAESKPETSDEKSDSDK